MKKRFLLLVFLIVFITSCGTGTPIPDIAIPTDAPATSTQAQALGAPTLTVTATVEATASATTAPTATSQPTSYGPTDFPDGINPLTGLKAADPDLLARRPLAVKVDVSMGYTRPPYGLSFADIVYNYYHNGATTRLHAIFYGEEAELVGSVRSGRLLDDLLVQMYKSVFAYGNADENIRARYNNSNYTDRLVIEGATAICPPTVKTPLCRFEPNTNSILLAGTAALTGYMNDKGVKNGPQDLDGMYFHPTTPSGGEPGSQVLTHYSSVDYNRWDYDEKTGQFLLFYDNVQVLDMPESYEPLTDRLTDRQIAAENVVILVVRDGYFRRPPGEIVEIFLNDGKGTAYAFRDGMVYEVNWNRPTQDSVLFLTNPDGSPFPFKPGTTWFQIINEESEITEEDGVWKFKYFIRP